MTEDEKKKTANLEDVQAFGRIIHNKGIGSEGTCSTAAATATKTVTVGTTFKPVAGATLIVTFQYAITVANATLTVTYGASGSQQTLAAKPIYYRGSALAANLVEAGATLVLRYDGTNYNIIGSLQTDPFPSQSGNNGKFLKTNGSAVSWADIPSDNTKTDKLPMTGAGAATENNFMAIDANGNIKDSGKNANSFLTQHQSIKTINGASMVGTGNVNLQIPLTFDTIPTENSNNPVKSGGIKSYVDPIKQNVDMLMLDHLNATTVIMTSESNSVAMAICYAQGWASSPTQMTYGEAQAVTDIGTVFSNNTNLTHFDELQYFGITEIKGGAFYACATLTKIGIPPSVVGIGQYAFAYCNTNEVYIRDLGKYCSMQATTLADLGWGQNPAARTYAKLFLNNVHVVDLNIPAGVWRVSRFALRNFQFRNVTIPQGCYYFPYRAFGGCVITGNVLINMPIKEWCENLSMDDYGDSSPLAPAQGDIYYITNSNENAEILQGAFTVPYTINKINYGAFINTKVTTVNVTSSTNIIRGFTLCNNLTQISIPNTATDFLIQICPLITTLEIPASCNIGYGNFSNCTSLTTIKFLGNRTNSLFTDFRSLPSSVTKIYCYSTTAFSLFGVTSAVSPTGTLYVPANSTGYDTDLWKTGFLDKGWTLSKTL